MKRTAALLLAAFMLVGTLSSTAMAKPDYDPYYDVHPVRIVAYPAHAVGLLLEWAIYRPIHAFVNLPGVSTVVGERVEDGIDRELTAL